MVKLKFSGVFNFTILEIHENFMHTKMTRFTVFQNVKLHNCTAKLFNLITVQSPFYL